MPSHPVSWEFWARLGGNNQVNLLVRTLRWKSKAERTWLCSAEMNDAGMLIMYTVIQASDGAARPPRGGNL